jgi:hypothetical protein
MNCKTVAAGYNCCKGDGGCNGAYCTLSVLYIKTGEGVILYQNLFFVKLTSFQIVLYKFVTIYK